MTILIWRCDDLRRFIPDDPLLDEPVEFLLCNMVASFNMRSKSSGIASLMIGNTCKINSIAAWRNAGEWVYHFLHLYKYINIFPSNNIYTYMVVHTLRYACNINTTKSNMRKFQKTYNLEIQHLTTVWFKGGKNTRWTVGRLKGQKNTRSGSDWTGFGRKGQTKYKVGVPSRR